MIKVDGCGGWIYEIPCKKSNVFISSATLKSESIVVVLNMHNIMIS